MLFRLSHALQHGTEALVYSSHSREAAASTCPRVDCQQYTLDPPFNSGANAAPVSMQALPAVQELLLAVVACFETTGNMCLTWDDWNYP